MNRTQKGAWFGLVVSGLLLTIQLIHTTLVSRMSRLISLSFVFSLVGLLAIFFAMMRSRAKVGLDERDEFISKRALLAAFILLAGFLVAAHIVTFLVLRPTASIPVYILPPILYSVFIIFLFVYSLALLVQYGWRDKDNE